MSQSDSTYQGSVNGTRQLMVPPGSATGKYYIPFSNLPWKTSWQHLKDYLRVVCSVEHVEVFNDSTSGWVCVLGREGFDAALDLLQNGIFKDRKICADGRNATEPLWIKDLVDVSSGDGGQPVSASHSAPAQGEVQYMQPAYATSPMYCNSDYGEAYYCYPYVGAGSYGVDAAAYAVNDADGAQYHYTAASSQAGDYQTWLGGDGGVIETAPSSTSSLSSAGAKTPRTKKIHSTAAAAAAAAPTRRRKIIIKQLPAQVTADEVLELVARHTGYGAGKVVKVDIPLASASSAEGSGHATATATATATRGYARVTLPSEEAASRTIRKLNGVKHGGRTLSVEHTKDGSSSSSSNSALSVASARDGSGGGGGHKSTKSKDSSVSSSSWASSLLSSASHSRSSKKDRKESVSSLASSSSSASSSSAAGGKQKQQQQQQHAGKGHQGIVIAHGSTSRSLK